MPLPEYVHEALHAKEVFLGVHRLSDAVGVEVEAVAGGHEDDVLFVVLADADRHPGAFQHARPPPLR